MCDSDLITIHTAQDSLWGRLGFPVVHPRDRIFWSIKTDLGCRLDTKGKKVYTFIRVRRRGGNLLDFFLHFRMCLCDQTMKIGTVLFTFWDIFTLPQPQILGWTDFVVVFWAFYYCGAPQGGSNIFLSTSIFLSDQNKKVPYLIFTFLLLHTPQPCHTCGWSVWNQLVAWDYLEKTIYLFMACRILASFTLTKIWYHIMIV